jgi:hypothetical protein
MAFDERRDQLLARVYSREGVGQPRTEHVDPATGDLVSVTDSEWELLEYERRHARRRAGEASGRTTPGARTPGAQAPGAQRLPAAGSATASASFLTAASEPMPAAAPAPAAASGTPISPGPARARRIAIVAVAVATLLLTATAPAWLPGANRDEPTIQISVTPRAPVPVGKTSGVRGGEQARGLGTMAVFRDPEHARGSLPGWLEPVFPSGRVVQLVGPDGPIMGVGVYAATTSDLIACLIARIEAAQMVWSCTSVRELAADGLVLRTPIPEGLGSGGDPDGDGVSGDAARSDLLIAEWHPDGTFLITREPA